MAIIKGDISGKSITNAAGGVSAKSVAPRPGSVFGAGSVLRTKFTDAINFLKTRFSIGSPKQGTKGASVRAKAEANKGKPVEGGEDLTETDLKDAGGPDLDANPEVKKKLDEVAETPEGKSTLKKWGLRGAVGLGFLMLIYKTPNPLEALENAADDAKEGVEGLSELLSQIFEAFKSVLQFMVDNWMVGAGSSLCCILLIIFLTVMSAAK
jgi:hypothetical protein